MQNNIVIASCVVEILTIHTLPTAQYNNYPIYYCVQYDSCIRINNFSQSMHYTHLRLPC